MAVIVLRAGKGSPLTNAEVDANFTNLNSEVAAAALTASWTGVTGKPATLAGFGITDAQLALVSGTNIKTVNGQSVLGSGNIQIDGGVTSFNTRTGAIALTSGDVTDALGFTPLNKAGDLSTGLIEFLSTHFALEDNTDTTKRAVFSLASLTTGTTRTYTLPNADGQLASLTAQQTFTLGNTFSSAVTMSATTSALNIGTSATSGVLTVGGVNSTGIMTLGRSTVSQTTNIQGGATASGSTKTINFGTGGLTGSTTTMAIGSTFGTTVAANGTWTFGTTIGGSISGNAETVTSITSSQVTTALGFTPYDATNPTGFITSAALTPYLTSAIAASTYQPVGSYLTGITSSQVTTALGFTPYNATNPNSYITASASITGNAATATALQTARTINGVSFNGSANVTVTTAGTGIGVSGTAVSIAAAYSPDTSTEIGNAIDLNTLSTAGFYHQTSNAESNAGVNYPVSNAAGSMIVQKHAGVGQLYQTYNPTSTNLYFRSFYQTVWGAWQRVLTDANFNGYAPTLTGTGASGTWGISITGNAATVTSVTSSQVTTALGFTPVNPTAIGSTVQGYDADLAAIAALAGTTGFLKKTAANTWTLDTATYLTGITSGQVTTALGFTPYDATNPSGYITSSALTPYLTSAIAASTYQPIGSYLTGITSAQVTTALGYTPANIAGDAFTGPISATKVGAVGLSTMYGATSSTNTGAFNAIMGNNTSATWLLSGTSDGVFRGGIQLLDGGGILRIYEGANYVQFGSNTLTATNLAGSGTAITALNATNLGSGTVPSARLTGAYTGITGLGILTSNISIGDDAVEGPIITFGAITGGSGYVDGTYPGVALTGGTGSGATADITVAGGLVTTVTLVREGARFTANDSLSATAATLGGTGSGFAVVVATVRSVALNVFSATPRLRLMNTANLVAGTELGSVLFGSVDTSAGARGDKVRIVALAEGTSGGGSFNVYTAVNAGEPGLGLTLTGLNALRLYNSASTFYVAMSHSATANRTLTLPDATDTLVGRATTDTLTNKTLTSPNISSIVNTGTLTLPTSTDTLVGRATTDTLTNKTLSTGTLFAATINGQDNNLTRVELQDYAYAYFDSTTTNALNFSNGSHQRWAPATGAQTLSITNWPPTGNLGELLIEGVNLGAATITWPTINWVTNDGTTTTSFSGNGVTLQTSGIDWVLLWTRDAGTTIYGKVVR